MSGKYTAGRQRFGEARLDWRTQNMVAQLVSVGYIFNPAHKTGADIKAAVGKPEPLTGTLIENGWAKCNTMTFRQVRGEEVGGVVIRCDGPSEHTLICFIDGLENFPMKPNGGDIIVTVPPQGLFRL